MFLLFFSKKFFFILITFLFLSKQPLFFDTKVEGKIPKKNFFFNYTMNIKHFITEENLPFITVLNHVSVSFGARLLLKFLQKMIIYQDSKKV